MMISPGVFFFVFFFNFLKILIFWVHRVVKGQKMSQNDKKFCLLCSISQESYTIWLPFMVQMCKMIISPGVFFNFKILIFLVVRGLKGQNWPKMTKNFCLSHLIFQSGKRAKNGLKLPISVCFALYLRNCRSYHQDFDNNIYRCFSLFFLKNATL